MRFTTFFFDLDETLYPSSSGLWTAIRANINAYMHERIGITLEQIEARREEYFREYGTTLRGLQANYQVDMEDYLAFVHAIPLDEYIHPDPAVRKMLAGIRARKFIFTNADQAHANRVLDALDLQGLFDGILDVHVIAPYSRRPETRTRGLVSCSMTRRALPRLPARWVFSASWLERTAQMPRLTLA
jgi:putative hydrolase of the HAD superfamily